MNPPWYDDFVTVTSVEIAFFSVWLLTMLVFRSRKFDDWSGPSIAAIVYVASSLFLFVIIAGRYIFSWPWEAPAMALVLKAVGVTTTAIFAYAQMKKDRL